MSTVIRRKLVHLILIIVAAGVCMTDAKPKPAPFVFPADESEEQRSFPATPTFSQTGNGTQNTLPLTGLPKKQGNYKIVRGKDGKLKAVLLEGRGGSHQKNLNDDDPVMRSLKDSFGDAVRAHKPMYTNNTRENSQIIFPTGSNLPLDLRNCTDTYCTQVPNYPSSFVTQLLRNQASGFHEFFGEDVVISQNISQRFDTGDVEETLCQSIEILVFPKLAQTRDDQWKLVVNEEQYKQGVRVERCLNPNAPCRFSETFGYGYTTECQQRYIYRQLLSLNDQNQLTKEVFKLPSCCKCIIKQVNVQNRFGSDQSAARRKRNAIT